MLAWFLLFHPPRADAADNAATGGVGGLNNGTLAGGDGSGEAKISLFTVDLALVKQARDLAGTVLPAGAAVAAGQDIWFVLYLDNTTPIAAGDLRLTDALDETQFSYVPGTLATTLVPTGSSNAAIWAGSWSALTDALGPPDDEASFVDTGGPTGLDRMTVGTEPVQVNQMTDVPAATLRAVRFRVRVN